MKILLEHRKELFDTEVDIRYPKMTEQIKHMEHALQAMNQTISARCEGREYLLNSFDIYYIESVDKKTFVYGKELVYESSKRLYQMMEELDSAGFVRVSKKCLINKYKLQDIKILPDSHMEATLNNGEKIVVSRKYISDIRKVLEHS